MLFKNGRSTGSLLIILFTFFTFISSQPSSASMHIAKSTDPSFCMSEATVILQKINTLADQSKSLLELIDKKYYFTTQAEAQAVVTSENQNLALVDSATVFSQNLIDEASLYPQDCSYSTSIGAMLVSLKASNAALFSNSSSLRQKILDIISAAKFYILNPKTAKAMAPDTTEILNSLVLTIDCADRIESSGVKCKFGATSDLKASIAIPVQIQISTNSGKWINFTAKNIPLNGSISVVVPDKLGNGSGIGTEGIQSTSNFGGKASLSDSVVYTADWYAAANKAKSAPKPYSSKPAPSKSSTSSSFTPHWVSNCIQIYSFITQSYHQQCDQAYATGPGHWIQSCKQVYNFDYGKYEQQCAQAYVQN